jgi:signal recognition particle subunit SRP54
MFENLTERLNRAFKNITGQGRLKEEHIKETLREVKKALLEADVALAVVKDFIHTVQAKAIGLEVTKALSPAQQFLKIVQDELTKLMGEANESLNLRAAAPAVILMAGLQGSGKTTTVAKLAKLLKDREKKSVMVVSCDVYRPAAIEQLKVLAEQVGVRFCPSEAGQSPVEIVENALLQARKSVSEVLVIDTAGRLHIDAEMMDEIKKVHKVANPVETLFVVDSMTGQDAANTARVFNEALPLTGIILTKADGDARGGAALSIRQITGKPIKFIGVGEKIEALEPFHPERTASRILGMGDLLTLIEEIERKVDKEKSEKLAKKLQKGKGFDLNDLREQMKQMLNMGGMSNLLDKLPGMSSIPQNVKAKVNDKDIVKVLAVLDSMTPHERRLPTILNSSRKRRIALGSGTDMQQVNKVLKQHEQMQKMMKKLGNLNSVTRMMQGLQNKLSPFS